MNAHQLTQGNSNPLHALHQGSQASSYLYILFIRYLERSVLLSDPNPRQSLHPQLLLHRFVHTV